MKKVISNLRKEHENFKKLLILLDTQLDLLNKEEEPDYQLMTDILCYMTQYANLVHHAREEAIFSCLLKKVPSVAAEVTEVVRQHRAIEQYGAHFHEKLEDIMGGLKVMKLQEIEDSGRLYIMTYRSHLGWENNDLFSHADQLLNENDWKQIETEAPSKPDPIFGDQAIKDRFHSVCNQLA